MLSQDSFDVGVQWQIPSDGSGKLRVKTTQLQRRVIGLLLSYRIRPQHLRPSSLE